MKEHVETITNLLLGAAYADKRLQGDEVASIRGLLTKLLGVDSLPSAQSDQIATFSPAKFNADEAAGSLKVLSADDRRRVVDMVAAVHESDEELDLAEDAYLKRVAKAIGLSDDEIGELTLDVEIEELAGSLGD
jgi:uncharacterized tellurite resistance protein B-like protein